jgi:hypothetical protein
MKDNAKPASGCTGPSSCSDLACRMLSESIQFERCRDRHDQRGNTGAALVAERARQRLKEYALELSEQNSVICVKTPNAEMTGNHKPAKGAQ